jgi:hypothetical protein
MRTVADVREAFAAFADCAPTEVQVILAEPNTRPRSWRPVAAVCVAVAAVVAVVAALAVALAPSRHAASAGSPAVPMPLRLGFSVDAPGYRIDLISVTANYQDAVVSGPTRDKGGTMRMYSPGVFKPGNVTGGTSVDVNGHHGYFAQLRNPEPGLLPGSKVVAWPYAADSWALVLVPEPAADGSDALAIARGVRFGGSTPLTVPFRLGYLPAGLVTRSVTESRSPVNEGSIAFGTEGPSATLTVTVNRQGIEDMIPHCSSHDAAPVTVRGYRGCFRDADGVGGGDRLQLQVPGGWLTLQVDRSRVFSHAVLRRIAASATLATLDQPTTWFDADTALPR